MKHIIINGKYKVGLRVIRGNKMRIERIERMEHKTLRSVSKMLSELNGENIEVYKITNRELAMEEKEKIKEILQRKSKMIYGISNFIYDANELYENVVIK